ncbi:hypothetical protein NQ318_006613 [Aromia moschata]|uniref:GST N-terminal domain-containing protein n=1 Tax=Aromia moschata TaxID=1265417 RepID=A0AAV8XXJ7_9CUCU|nr:hypothetical protein NQ318_006613 [Aromia moschata]
MTYCPYAERTRLVLKAKGIPHDIVNINLTEKPEWYFKIHPEVWAGKVPALLDGDKVVIESLDISDYLDEKYPENPPVLRRCGSEEEGQGADPEDRTGDGRLRQNTVLERGENTRRMGGGVPAASAGVRGRASQKGNPPSLAATSLEWWVDYMLWPWSERRGAIRLKLGTKLPYKEDQLTHLHKWQETMAEQPLVAEIAIPPETFYKLVEARLKGITVDYDNL